MLSLQQNICQKRWNIDNMCQLGKALFTSIYRKKQQLNHNHEIHYLAREFDCWLNEGINSLIAGSYNPQHLKRYYFADGMVEQLHLTDRILQNLLLKQIKATFPHIINPNCLHMHGPHGVKLATSRIKEALSNGKYTHVMRFDIKSYYKSIQHHLLLDDIKQAFNDSKIISMLTNIIKNPIDTPKGTTNPDNGIPLRGPLSQLFSALYLKPLDDAFDKMEVFYLRYQDDGILLCKSARQLTRCKQKISRILRERRLTLSKKKSRFGIINSGFHFLGVNYLETQAQDNIRNACTNKAVQNKCIGGAT